MNLQNRFNASGEDIFSESRTNNGSDMVSPQFSSIGFLHPDQQSRVIEALVRSRQQQTANAIRLNDESIVTENCNELLRISIPYDIKFLNLKFRDLLEKNSDSVSELKRLRDGLLILQKYGKNLMHPPNKRPKQWRAIAHGIMDHVQGCKDVLIEFGYTNETEHGLEFPQLLQPDLTYISLIMADVALAIRELDLYLEGAHFSDQYFVECIKPEARIVQNNSSLLLPSTQSPAIVSSHTEVLPRGDKSVVNGNSSILVTSGICMHRNSIEENPNNVKDALSLLKPAAAPLFSENNEDEMCDSCGQQLWSNFCNQCEENKFTCDNCNSVLHGHWKRCKHKVVRSELCDYCGIKSVRWFCSNCETNQLLCTSCNANIHQNARRAQHVPRYFKHLLLSSLALSGPDNNDGAASGLTLSPIVDRTNGDIGASGPLQYVSAFMNDTGSDVERVHNHKSSLGVSRLDYTLESDDTSLQHLVGDSQLHSHPSPAKSFVKKVKTVGSSFVNKLLKVEHRARSNVDKSPDPKPESAWFLNDGSLNNLDVENVDERDLDDELATGKSESELFKINQKSYTTKSRIENNETNDLISNIRRLEGENFHVDEVLLAHQHAENSSAVLAWLQSDWLVMQNALHSSAFKNFPELESVVGSSDMKASLIALSGNVQDSVKLCRNAANYRIESMSQSLWCSVEVVTQALGANAGDWVKASKDLHETAIAKFCSNWKSDDERDVMFRKIEEQLHCVDDRQRKVRLLLAELQLPCWADGESVLSLWEHFSDNDSVTLGDIVEAQATCCGLSLNEMKAFLQWECVICSCQFPASKFLKLAMCECRICKGCMQRYYSVQISSTHVTRWVCPNCQNPDMMSNDADVHLQFLDSMLRVIVTAAQYELFAKKLRDWHLMSDVNFRWCQGGGAGCGSGSIYNVQPGELRVTCRDCGKAMCFMCKKPWEVQHENVSCEAFAQWKRDNDPQQQAQALSNFLEENGIDCPQCKYRFALAKGGCMHFKCNRCTHEFCCGCSQPFNHGNSCKKFASCAGMGLHCHHPRDCLFYMRDMSINSLRKLLHNNHVVFERERQACDLSTCMVLEQKETGTALRDEPCGREVQEGCDGLCEVHYKEYLVGLINKHGIDPVTVWSLDDMENELKRYNKVLPVAIHCQTETERKSALIRVIQEELPLLRGVCRNMLMF
jgi:hypothetical protein